MAKIMIYLPDSLLPLVKRLTKKRALSRVIVKALLEFDEESADTLIEKAGTRYPIREMIEKMH